VPASNLILKWRGSSGGSTGGAYAGRSQVTAAT